MNKLRIVVAVGCCLITTAMAGMPEVAPYTGFSLGLGGSYHHITVPNDLTVSDSTGYTTTQSYLDQLNTFSPSAQMSYTRHFTAITPWYYGGKFTYSYTNISSEESYELQQVTNSRVSTLQTQVNDALMLFLMVGRIVENFSFYLGAGPTVLETVLQQRYSVLQETLFSNVINGQGIYEQRWIWGGAGQIGLSYYFDANWFFDLNYTYAATTDGDYLAHTQDKTTPKGGKTTTVITQFKDRISVTDQALMASINWLYEI